MHGPADIRLARIIKKNAETLAGDVVAEAADRLWPGVPSGDCLTEEDQFWIFHGKDFDNDDEDEYAR